MFKYVSINNLKRTPDVKRWTPEFIRKYGMHNIVKRMNGFRHDIPGSAGEMMKLRIRLTAMIHQIYADTGKLPLLFPPPCKRLMSHSFVLTVPPAL